MNVVVIQAVNSVSVELDKTTVDRCTLGVTSLSAT